MKFFQVPLEALGKLAHGDRVELHEQAKFGQVGRVLEVQGLELVAVLGGIVAGLFHDQAGG
jgi:hypothetical protein